MSIAISNKIIDKYFSFLGKLDNKSKRKLIAKLNESMDTKEKITKISSLYGAWEDERESDEIIKDIIDSRVNKVDFESF